VPVLESDSEGKPYCVFPINGDARRWALYVEQAGNVVPLPAEDPDQEQLGKRYVRPPQIANNKYGVASLNDVKDWILNWEQGNLSFPHIYASTEKLDEVRELSC